MFPDPAQLARLDPAEAWRPWEPTASDPWSLKWAGHLYRRAAFGGRWDELQAAVRGGVGATLDQLFAGAPGHAEFDRIMDAAGPDRTDGLSDPTPLEAWWLHRMVLTLHPLRERMTLFWHQHFATSISKVRQTALMKGQNILLRRHALGRFRPLLLEVSRDPAMLVWLDSNSNVRGRPNENYARELMELFSLGVGNYTERDVQEAARAFTGWHTTAPVSFDGRSRVEFVFRNYVHDDGAKTVLGQAGNWDGGDIVRIVLDQRVAALFLVRKIYRHFVSEAVTPPDRFLEPLADRFRASDYDIADLMRAVLGSRHFFSDFAYRQRIKSPAEYLVGLLRALSAELRPAGPMNGSSPLDGLGQRLFAPPSVKGWDGGRTWLNSATLLARHNLAWRLLQSPTTAIASNIDPYRLVRGHAGGNEPERQLDFLLQLLLQPGREEVDATSRQRLLAVLSEGNPRDAALETRFREISHAIVLMPLYQLA